MFGFRFWYWFWLKRGNAFPTKNFARVIAARKEIKISQVDTKGYAGSDFAQRHVVTSYTGAIDPAGGTKPKHTGDRRHRGGGRANHRHGR